MQSTRRLPKLPHSLGSASVRHCKLTALHYCAMSVALCSSPCTPLEGDLLKLPGPAYCCSQPQASAPITCQVLLISDQHHAEHSSRRAQQAALALRRSHPGGEAQWPGAGGQQQHGCHHHHPDGPPQPVQGPAQVGVLAAARGAQCTLRLALLRAQAGSWFYEAAGSGHRP